MKPVIKHYLDDLSQTDQHYINASAKLVDMIRSKPYSADTNTWYGWLNECGQVLRYRILIRNKQ